jgi:hypothetical protein
LPGGQGINQHCTRFTHQKGPTTPNPNRTSHSSKPRSGPELHSSESLPCYGMTGLRLGFRTSGSSSTESGAVAWRDRTCKPGPHLDPDLAARLKVPVLPVLTFAVGTPEVARGERGGRRQDSVRRAAPRAERALGLGLVDIHTNRRIALFFMRPFF